MMKFGVMFGAFLVAASALPTAAAQNHYQGDICGNKVDIELKAPGADANPKLKEFFGVWGTGRWSTSTCTGLIVSEINGDKPVVHYYYGAGPDAPTAGVYTPADPGLKSGKWLLFHSSRGMTSASNWLAVISSRAGLGPVRPIRTCSSPPRLSVVLSGK